MVLHRRQGSPAPGRWPGPARRLILLDGGALGRGEPRHGVPSVGLVLEQHEIVALVLVRPDDRGHGGVIEPVGWARAGCSRPSCPAVTSIPSRMCWVNQPTLPMGYQFCSRSPLTPLSVEPAGLVGRRVGFARPGPGRRS